MLYGLEAYFAYFPAHQPAAPATGGAPHRSDGGYKYPAHLAAHGPGLTRPLR